MIDIGKKVKPFKLDDAEGRRVSLKDYVGKWFVLYFYPKDDTPGCTNEAIDFSSLYSKFKKLGAAIVGVSPDSSESHDEFIDKYSLKIELLADPTKDTIKAYEAWGLKKNYGKEYEGLIRTTYLVDSHGKIAFAWTNVKPRVKRVAGEVKHAEVVLEKLKELKG